MTDRTYELRDKWGEGPWQNEPDEKRWITKSGYRGMILRNGVGTLCGYVELPATHPVSEKHYDDFYVKCHGGLTFAGTWPDEGSLWWVGFDCAHCGDYLPMIGAIRETIPGFAKYREYARSETYKDMAYVTEEVEQLAERMKVMADAS